jgi:hypothetical protein
MNKCVQLTTAICASLAMTGCMTMKPMDVDPAQLRGALKQGDQVQVVTSSGQELQFKIDSLDETGLQGGGQHIAYNDVRSISRKQIDMAKSGLIALGVVAAGALAAGGGGGGGGGSSGY